MAVRNPTDRHLAMLARHLVRLYVEIERGLRNPRHIEPAMTFHAYMKAVEAHRTTFRRARPVVDKDLGRAVVSRLSPRHAHATVTVRRLDGGWEAVMLDMFANGDGPWLIHDLDRTRPRDLEHDVESKPQDLDAQTRQAAAGLRSVQAARDATARTLNDLLDTRSTAGTNQIDRLREELGEWTRLACEFERDLEELRSRQRLRDELAHPGAPSAVVDPATHLTDVLGDPSQDEVERQRWMAATGLILGYRDRWSITDADDALGPDPVWDDQRRDRDAVIDRVLELTEPPSGGTGQACEWQDDFGVEVPERSLYGIEESGPFSRESEGSAS